MVVFFFVVKSESKRSPGTDFCSGGHEGKYSSYVRLFAANFRIDVCVYIYVTLCSKFRFGTVVSG